jgi:hypothetical protein
VQILVCGDFNLKPAASDYDIDAMEIPETTDLVIVTGDLTHRAGPDDIALAKWFISQFVPEIPVVYLPGNHDHAPTEERVVAPLDGAYTGHRTAHKFDGVTIVEWGCEQRTLSPAIDQTDFDALDSRKAPRRTRRYHADQVADRLGNSVSRHRLWDLVTRGRRRLAGYQ